MKLLRWYRKLHMRGNFGGLSLLPFAQDISQLVSEFKSRSLLDYGCGKGLLARELDFPIWEYDPAIPGKDNPPRAADMVVCVDVLEHIEPDYLSNVLFDISRCTKKVCYLVISTRPATKTLPDGRNTHLIQEGRDWWVEKLKEFFVIPDNGVFDKDSELHIIVSPKELKESREKIIVEKPALVGA